MLCALGMYLYLSPVMLIAILLVTIPPLVLPRKMNEQLKVARMPFPCKWRTTPSSSRNFLAVLKLSGAFCERDAYTARHRTTAAQACASEQSYQQSLNSMVVNTSLISNLIFPVVMLVGLFLALTAA